MTHRLALATLIAVLAGSMVGCAKPLHQRYVPYFDAVFENVATVRTRETGLTSLELSDPLVSDINTADYGFNELRVIRDADLDDKGEIVQGSLTVLDLSVLDREGVTLSDALGKTVTMRLLIADDWTITKGHLSAAPNNVSALWKSMTAGPFHKGACRMMYLDDDIAIGQFSAEFEAFRIYGSFRALISFR